MESVKEIEFEEGWEISINTDGIIVAIKGEREFPIDESKLPPGQIILLLGKTNIPFNPNTGEVKIQNINQ